MEAERRSTMSSLKGQLSNVEGSVKSMKAAVVVGSVLTVACLAAVFGVTILANEVSKEVKVSNGTLATKAGKPVLTTSTYASTKAGQNAHSISFEVEGGATVTSAVNAIVVQGETTTIVCDELVLVQKSGAVTDVSFTGSLESIVGGSVSKRALSGGAFEYFMEVVVGIVEAAVECIVGEDDTCRIEFAEKEINMDKMGKFKR